jgi:hypothetical protein
MPIAELILIKKAIKGVLKFFLTKLAAFIVKKVSFSFSKLIMTNIVQSDQDDAKDGVGG